MFGRFKQWWKNRNGRGVGAAGLMLYSDKERSAWIAGYAACLDDINRYDASWAERTVEQRTQVLHAALRMRPVKDVQSSPAHPNCRCESAQVK